MNDTDAHDLRVYLAGEALDTYEGQASARLVLDMVKTHYEDKEA